MWTALINTALGLWLMASPAVLAYGDPAQANDRILGPIIATFAFVAAWEVLRSLRWVNLPLGAWLVFAPFVLGYEATAATWNGVIVGIAVMVCSLFRGNVHTRFGGGWRMLWRQPPPEAG